MNRSTNATAARTSTERNGPGPGTRLLADIFIGMIGAVAVSAAAQSNSRYPHATAPIKEINMIKIESNIDPVRALELMAKIARFVRENARDADDVTVETSMSGEITVKVRRQVVAEAKKDFINDQCWKVKADERIADALRMPEKMF